MVKNKGVMKSEDSGLNKAYLNIRSIIEKARSSIVRTIDNTMVQAYWLIGKEIVEVEQKGKFRAEYGKKLIKDLSIKLTKEYGKGFNQTNLWYMKEFYTMFTISHEAREEFDNSTNKTILHTLPSSLSWTHYRFLLKVKNPKAREFYINETIENNWSTPQLERQINSFYYERLLSSHEKKSVVMEAKRKLKSLIDIKTGKLTHQDIGQMDMYIRIYEDLVKPKDSNPTIGLILCTEKDHTVVKYSVLNKSKQLFASKYRLYLPTEKELMDEIERERRLLEVDIDKKW